MRRLARALQIRYLITVLGAVLALAVPARAAAQTPAASKPANAEQPWAIGEKYKIEFSYTFWQPSLEGSVSSDGLDLVGSRVDLTGDLSLERTRFDDFRFVIRPAKKHRIKVKYTPITFTGNGTLTRDISFSGIVYPISLPVESRLEWKVFRVGYEWDFFYHPRGFIGVLVTGGFTTLDAGISSIIGSATAEGDAPLLEIGAAGRFYPIRHLAINVEGSGLKLTDLAPDTALKTMSWDVSATYNITNNFGVSGGWRRLDTNLQLPSDSGELDFKGFWFGGSIRY